MAEPAYHEPEEEAISKINTLSHNIETEHSLLKELAKKIQVAHKDGATYVEHGRAVSSDFSRVADGLEVLFKDDPQQQAFARDSLKKLAVFQSHFFDLLRDLNQTFFISAVTPLESFLNESRASRTDVKRFAKLTSTLESSKKKQQEEVILGTKNAIIESSKQLSVQLGKINGNATLFGARFFTAFYSSMTNMLKELQALTDSQLALNNEFLEKTGQKQQQQPQIQQVVEDKSKERNPTADGEVQDRRSEVLSQIIDAEKKHVTRLESAQKFKEHLSKDVSEKKINLSQDELAQIFQNIDDMYSIHISILPLLEQAFGTESNGLTERVVNVINQQMASIERVYQPYLEGLSLALGTLEKAKKHKSFAGQVKSMEQQQVVFGKFPLDQLIAMPARHIKKFQTFLKLFHENTPVKDKGWFVFHEMLENFDELIGRLLRAKSQGDNAKRLIDVKDKLKDFDGEIVEIGRCLIHDDAISLLEHIPLPSVGSRPQPIESGNHYYGFLFNDCFELCTKLSSGLMSGSETFQHVAKFKINGMRVDDIPDNSEMKNAFRIDFSGEVITVSAHGPSQKITWISRLRLASSEWKRTQVYGTDPEELMKRETEQEHIIPRILEDAIAYVEKKGLEIEGIFRLSVSARLISSLQLRVNTGKIIEFDDPLVAAVMLKQWLSSTPSPLLLRHLYDDWLKAGGIPNNSEAIEALKKLVAKLPRSNRLILNSICRMCQKIASKREINLMGTQALSIVIAPTILRPINEYDQLSTNNARLTAFERLILLYNDVFVDAQNEEIAAKKEVAVFREWRERQKHEHCEELRKMHHERQKSSASVGKDMVSAMEWMKKRKEELELQEQEKEEEIARARKQEIEAELERQSKELEERMKIEKKAQEERDAKKREIEEEVSKAEEEAKTKYEAEMLENQKRVEEELKKKEEERIAEINKKRKEDEEKRKQEEEEEAKRKAEEEQENEDGDDEDLPICAACNQKIKDDEDGLSALGKEWHSNCFVCTECKGPLGKTIKSKDGKPYCVADYERLFLPKCGKCGKPIPGAAIKALEQVFHPECFVCSKCSKSIAGGFSAGSDGNPICSACK